MDAFRLYYDENISHMLDNTESSSKKGLTVGNFYFEFC
jgi:hypothetical protein